MLVAPARARLLAGLAVVPLVLAAAGSSVLAADPTVTIREDELDPAVSEAIAETLAAAYGEISAPGVVVGIDTPDGRWVGTIGTQDWGPGGTPGSVPMEPDLLQRVGSVTKTFTVTALLQLAEQGRLSLDDPIGTHVDGLPRPEATLGQLAAMRSGIPSYTFDEAWVNQLFADPSAAWTPEQLIDVIRGESSADRPGSFEPGTQTFYSNTNTILLGMVIEQVTGQPLPEVIRTGIIEPLGLSHTDLPLDATFADPHARGYTVQGQGPGVIADATDWNPSWGWAAGAMTSSLDDLLVYGRALATGEGLLGPEMQRRRLDSFDFSIPPNSPARAYGLGIGLANGWLGHTGELMGYNTVVQHHPEAGLTLVVLANSDIKAGECSAGQPALPDGPRTGPCEDPAVHVANSVAAALGSPLAGG